MIKIKIIAFLILLSIGFNACTSSQSSPAETEISQSEQIAKNVDPKEFNELIAKADGQLLMLEPLMSLMKEISLRL